MLIKRKLFAQKEKTGENNSKKEIAAGVGIAGAGAIGLGKMDKSQLSGRVTRYHATDKNLLDKIKEEGLKSDKANGETYTKKVLNHLPEEELKNKVYLGKKKSVANSVAIGRKMRGHGEQGMLKLKIDYDDWKNMKKVENPELMGAKNGKEFIKKLIEKKGEEIGIKNYDALPKAQQQVLNLVGKIQHHNLGEGGTEVIEGDIKSKFIKGGKGYEKNSLKKVMNYAKNNPKRFAKGLGKAGVATAAIGTGAVLVYKGVKNKKKD